MLVLNIPTVTFAGSRKIDKLKNQNYNKIGASQSCSGDCFCSSIKKSDSMDSEKNLNQEIKKLKASEKMDASPVSFLVPLLGDFLSSQISSSEFSEKVFVETKKAQFMFFHMSQKDIADNKRIFVEEFKFADDLNKFLAEEFNDEGLRKNVIQLVTDYNRKGNR